MTLIAATSNFGCPVLIGDILVSSENLKANISLPTYLDGADKILPADQKFFPSDLRRKIYVITDNLAIALAGSLFEMKQYLEDVRSYFKYMPSTEENFKKFVNEYDINSYENISVILMVVIKKPEGIMVIPANYGSFNNTRVTLSRGCNRQWFWQ